MPTHSELAAQLLRDAASFFRTIGEQNAPMKDQMAENAAVFDEVAVLVETDPLGEINDGHVHNNHDHAHEGGCCGGHGHSHGHDDHAHDDHSNDDKKQGGCGGGGGGCCGGHSH